MLFNVQFFIFIILILILTFVCLSWCQNKDKSNRENFDNKSTSTRKCFEPKITHEEKECLFHLS